MTRRLAVLAVAVGAAAVAGFVALTASDDLAVDIAGIVLLGAALVTVVGWVFYEVGRSEDRERAERESRPGP